MPYQTLKHTSIPLPAGQVVTQIVIDGPFASFVYDPDAQKALFDLSLNTAFTLNGYNLQRVGSDHPFHPFFSPDPYPFEHTHWVTTDFKPIDATPFRAFCVGASQHSTAYIFGPDGCQTIVDTLTQATESAPPPNYGVFFKSLVDDFLFSPPTLGYGLLMAPTLLYKGYNDISALCQSDNPALREGCENFTSKAIGKFFFFYYFLPCALTMKVLIPTGKALYTLWSSSSDQDNPDNVNAQGNEQ